MAAPRVAALVDDLMDRSRVAAAMPDVAFVRSPDAVGDADVVVLDLGGHAAEVAALRAAHPDVRIVAFGRHDDVAALDAARAAGADRVLPRSQFFRDPAGAMAPERGAVPPFGRAGSERRAES